MKHIALLSALFLMTTCGGNTISNAPTCDTAGMNLSHQTRPKGAATSNGSEYHISLSIDGKAMDAIADTGSSNLIVANNIGFKPTGSTTDAAFSIGYGDGTPPATQVNLDVYSGTVGLDCLKADAVSGYQYGYITSYIPAPNSGEVQQTLLGLAYGAARGSPQNKTFFTQLSTKAKMNNEFAMLLCGAGNKNSNITFGGTGVGKEAFQYVPIIEQSYYVINAGNITIKGAVVGTLANGNDTIIDSGTTLNLVPTATYNAIVTALGLSSTNLNPGNEITCPDITGMPDVQIALDNNVTLTIKPNTYFKKLEGGGCFFGFSPTNGNLNILGQVTMENYHVHFVREANTNLPAPANGYKMGAIGFSPNTACKN